MAEHDDVLVGRLVEEQRRNRDERVEPAARLIDGLGDEVRGEALLEDFFILERIMPLRERHGTGVEPAVDDFLDAVHLLAAFRTFDRDVINVRTVQLDIVGAVVAHLLELGDGADDVLLAAVRADPDRQRRAPVAVAREAPVLHVLEPVAEAALADGLRDPVDGVVVRDELVLDRRHLDEPRRERVVEERRVAAPAVRIAMRELRRLEELALLLEILEDQRVGLLDKDARPVRVLRELALAVDEIHEAHAVFHADAVIVLTEGRRHVDDARAVLRRDVVVAEHDERFLARLHLADGIGIERLVLPALELLALAAREHRALARHVLEHFVDERLGEDVFLLPDLHLHIVDLRIHAEREVRRQRPGRRRPGEIAGIRLALHAELDHRRALRDVLVALRDLVRGERRAAARAVRDDLVPLVEQAFLPDLLERPPFRLDEIILVGDVGMLHVRPETDDIGELLPHALVLPDRLAALLDKRLDAVRLDLLLAVDADGLLDLELDGQAVRIPARLPQNLLALHRGETRQHILDDARQHMADMRLAVRRRRAVVERERIAALALVDGLLRDVMLLPEFQDFLFPIHEIEVRVDFLIQTNSSSWALENAGECCVSQRYPIHKKAFIPKQDEGSYAHQSTTYFTDQHLLFPNAETRRSLLLVQPAAQERSSRQVTPRRLPPHPARLRFPLAVLSPSSHLRCNDFILA